VTEIDSRTGLVRRRLPIPVTPTLVAAGADGLWVAGHRTGAAPDVLYHYDRAGRRLHADVPNDITALAVGGGRAWVAHDGVPRLLGFGARVRVRDQQWLAAEASELVYGDKRVWASEPATDSLGRFDPRSGRIAENRVAPRPAGLAVAGGRVFVASYTTQNVVVVDQQSLKPVGDPISVPLNPWGVEAGAGHVWVSGLGTNALSRIDY
jgi:streptogramin lyase